MPSLAAGQQRAAAQSEWPTPQEARSDAVEFTLLKVVSRLFSSRATSNCSVKGYQALLWGHPDDVRPQQLVRLKHPRSQTAKGANFQLWNAIWQQEGFLGLPTGKQGPSGYSRVLITSHLSQRDRRSVCLPALSLFGRMPGQPSAGCKTQTHTQTHTYGVGDANKQLYTTVQQACGQPQQHSPLPPAEQQQLGMLVQPGARLLSAIDRRSKPPLGIQEAHSAQANTSSNAQQTPFATPPPVNTPQLSGKPEPSTMMVKPEGMPEQMWMYNRSCTPEQLKAWCSNAVSTQVQAAATSAPTTPQLQWPVSQLLHEQRCSV